MNVTTKQTIEDLKYKLDRQQVLLGLVEKEKGCFKVFDHFSSERLELLIENERWWREKW